MTKIRNDISAQGLIMIKQKLFMSLFIIVLIFGAASEAYAYRLDAETVLVDYFSDPANTNEEDWRSRPVIDLWNRIGGESAQFPNANFTNGDKWTAPMPDGIYKIYEDLSKVMFGSVRPVNTGFAYDYSYYIGSSRVHEGFDIDAKEGTNVRSATSGTVYDTVPKIDGPWGSDNVFVFIKEDGTDRIWIYGHLKDGSLKIGDTVREGSFLGRTNNFNHLHLAVYSESAHSYSPYYDWPKSAVSEGGYRGHVAEMLENRCSPIYAYWLYKNSLPSRCANPADEPIGQRDYLVSIAIVIDVSGSMSDRWADGVKMDSAKAAALELLDILENESNRDGQRYQASLISFSYSASVVQQITSDFDLLRDGVESLRPGGGTNIGEGLEKALMQLDSLNDDLSYVVFLSDGMSNQGRSSEEIMDWLRRLYRPDWVDFEASVYGFIYDDGLDTRELAGVGEAKLRAAGYSNTILFTRFTESNRPISELALERVASDIVFSFNGHANNSAIGFGEESLFTSDITSLNLGQMKLAMLAGCKTAGSLNGGSNITETFKNSGAASTIGFRNYTNNNSLQPWLELFWENVLDEAEPLDILQAFNETNSNYSFREYRSSSSNERYRLEPQIYLSSLEPVFLVMPKDALGVDDEEVYMPKVFTVGYGDPGDLDEELLKLIAHITGGEYFYGDESFALSNIFIKAQQMGTGEVVGEFTGAIGQNEKLEAGRFYVGSGYTELKVALNWPGSHIDLILTDPAGNTVNENYRGLQLFKTARPAYVVIENPMEGSWTAELFGKDIPGGSSPYYVIASISDIFKQDRSVLLEFMMVISFAVLIILFLAPRLVWGNESERRL